MVAPSSGEESSLATKCMDFCHALASQGKDFRFSLTIGPTFTFSLDTKEGKKTMPARSKKSPSALKRNAKRRQVFLMKKSQYEAASSTGLESNQKPVTQLEAFQCDHCESSFKTENGLKIHRGKSHKEASSTEKLRKSSTQSSLLVSPIRDQGRVETCHNCGMDMSPTHQCQSDHDSTLDDAIEVKKSPTCKGQHHTLGPCGCTEWGTPCMYYTPDFMQ